MERKTTKKELFKDFGNFVSVKNAPSRNGYNVAPNQFIIEFENGLLFQSYDSIVAGVSNKGKFVTDKHDYSATTNRFVRWYLGMTLDERRKAIKNGDLDLIHITD